MNISFGSRDVEDLCRSERTQAKKLGTAAKKLRARLEDLAAAANVSELVLGHPHPLQGDREGEFAVRLDAARRLTFTADHDPIPRRDDGAIDWARVTSILIVYIGDYHD